jgi:peptide/nickel transport system substrate-binding protein
MRARNRLGTVALAAALLAAACTGGSPKPKPSPSVAGPPRGGTLRLGFPAFIRSTLTQALALDPQKDYFFDSWELFRCCLLRTLLSYPGRPTRQGGALLQPDLAASMPEVSADGLTWTFHIRPGIRYAPPLQNVEITSGDFIRALAREANPKISGEGYAFYYSIIQGFDDFAAGRSASISGLEAPDPRTLRVHLTEPAGDLGDLFALAATAPIPPSPADPSAPYGAAQGHDDGYGRFLVSSGPYMFEGSQALDFSKPAGGQLPVTGYVPKERIVLVRNPSWKPASDPLRPAYVDRMEIDLGGTTDEYAGRVDAGTMDLMLLEGPPVQAPLSEITAYQDDPSKGRVDVEPRDFVRYISINLATPPFDDIHVRKAINYVLDKQALLDQRGGAVVGDVIGHISLNSLENDLLLNYDPYASPGHRGDVSAAKAEMAQSSYDHNGDGICDDPVCRRVLGVALQFGPDDHTATIVKRNFGEIGIHLIVRAEDPPKVFADAQDPRRKVPLAVGVAWGRDFLNASNYFTPLFASSQIGNPSGANYSLLGATQAQLRQWGYSVGQVPSVDDRIQACLANVGEAQVRCWSDLDQYMMGNVIPWVPYVSENHVQVVPRRIVGYSYDQFAGLPALDRIAIRSG